MIDLPKKNLCLVSRSVYPNIFSDHTQNLRTFNEWRSFWDGICVLSQTESKKSVFYNGENNINAVLLPKKRNQLKNLLYFFFFGIKEIYFLNRKYKFLAFQASDTPSAVVCYLARLVFGGKFIYEIQGDIFNLPSNIVGHIHSKTIKLLGKFFAIKADAVRVISPFILDNLVFFGVDKKKIYLVYPRCDDKIFNINAANRFKPKIFLENSKNIIYLGNLTTGKGVDVLIKAFALLSNETESIRLIICGEGEQKQYLTQLVTEMKLNNKIYFTGKIAYEHVPSYIYHSDILVLPSFHEGFGRVIIEAMALDTVVIASRVNGIKHLISDTNDGLLFEAGNEIDLGDKIMKLIGSKSLYMKLKENAQDKYTKFYSYKKSITDYINMYKNIFYE